jgi:hypothetical protein
MGQQLTAQYERATGGMKEVVIFGAMMMQLRERHPELTKKGPAAKSKSTRGLTPESEDPITLTKWLETYAPTVKKATAYRFLHVTESIADKYAEIVGAKVAKAMPLPQLVTAPTDELPEGFDAKQLMLFDYVSGTSQKSWLDMFSPDSPQKRGKKNAPPPPAPKPKTAEELAEDAQDELNNLLTALDGWFLAAHHTRIPKQLRETADAVFQSASKKLKAVK